MEKINVSVIVPVALYLIGIYVMAVYCNKRLSRSDNFMEEYFIGSRGMGGFVLAMTLVATYTSASSFIGGPGVAYKMGLGWVLLAMIQVPTAWLTLGVLGKKFAIVARRIGAVTVNDVFRARYESPAVVIAGSVSLLAFFVAAMTAQFIGGARLFQGMTGLSYNTGLAIFAVTVIVYTTVGGFRAVALTDALQGVVMIVGTTALLFGIVSIGGGMENVIATLRDIDPDLITPHGPDGFISKPFILSFWVLVCLGVVGLPHTAVRCMGYRDSRSMHGAMVIGTFVLAFVMLGMHLCGALGRAVVPGIEVGDTIMPILSLKVLPPVVAGIFLAGPLAGVMSTIDSQLILASATIVKDIYVNYVSPESISSERGIKKVRIMSLAATAMIGTVVLLAAFRPPELIVWINIFAFGGMQAAFLWPLVLGLYWKRANGKGALASMVTGVITYISMASTMKSFMGMNVIIPTLLVGLVAFVLVSLLSKRPNDSVIDLFWME